MVSKILHGRKDSCGVTKGENLDTIEAHHTDSLVYLSTALQNNTTKRSDMRKRDWLREYSPIYIVAESAKPVSGSLMSQVRRAAIQKEDPESFERIFGGGCLLI